MPGWCSSFKLQEGGEELNDIQAILDKGYIVLDRKWVAGDRIVLELDMPVQTVRAHKEVEANQGRIAVLCGPIIYCMEQADHPELAYDSITISDCDQWQVLHRPELLGGVSVITGLGTDPQGSREPLTFIPYYAWANRQQGFMQVWVCENVHERLYTC